MFDNILLESEQLELLLKLINADRNLPREKRQEFFVLEPGLDSNKHLILHKGLNNDRIEASWLDIKVLADKKLIQMSNQHGDLSFGISPLGFKFFEYLDQKSTEIENHSAFQSDTQSTLHEHNLPKLRQQMIESFNIAELKEICFDLHEDPENLQWNAKPEFVMQLIDLQKRKKQIDELLNICRSRRPKSF